MNISEYIDPIKNAMIEGITEDAEKYLKVALNAGIDYKRILNDAVIKGAEKVGILYEKKEFFLADMLIAGDAINTIMEILTPLLKDMGDHSSIGKVLIGTPEGDIHDIGKSLVISLLTGQGFDVVDLGVDVPVKTFIDEAKKTNPDIIGISALLTVTISKIREIVVALKEVGISAKIIIGGGIMSEETCNTVGADAWTKDGWDGIKKIKGLLNINE